MLADLRQVWAGSSVVSWARMRKLVLVTLAASIALGAAALAAPDSEIFGVSEAEACAAPPPEQPSRRVSPSNDLTGAPLNTRIVVQHLATPEDVAREFELRTEAGEVVETNVEVDGTLLIASPAAPLAANAVYEIFLLPIASDSCALENEECFGTELARASRFTTGDSIDTTPPVFSGVPTIGEQSANVCVGVDCSCDFEWGTAVIGFRWPEGSDDSGEVLYNIYSGGERKNRLRTTTASLVGKACWGNDLQSFLSTTIGYSEAPYTAVAVDLAGNETEAAMEVILAPLDCTELDEANPSPEEEPPAGDAASSDGSCSVGSSKSSVLFGLAMLVLFARRRRRVAAN